jgi:hypothetical protein
MDQETQHILEMVHNGKITVDQAAMLLDALEGGSKVPAQRTRPARSLHVAVKDTRNGRTKVNVNIPFGLVEVASRFGLTMGLKHTPELADIDFNEIIAAIKNGAEGTIVDVEDDDERQHVTVSVD